MSLTADKILPSTAVVSFDHLQSNVGLIRRIAKNSKIMAVVKANAYGHGIVPIARALVSFGVEHLAVQTPEEAIGLRMAGITAPILIFGYTHAAYAADIIHHDLTPTIFDYDLAVSLNHLAHKNIPIHIKIDTGMGWAGISSNDALPFINRVNKLPNIDIKGLFTHFAAAGTDPIYTKKQGDEFISLVSQIKEAEHINPILHACNSTGTMNFPEYHFDYVRPGLMLYGVAPGGKYDSELLPVLSWTSLICNMKVVHPGESIGYECSYKAAKTMVVGTIPVGYADGWNWRLKNGGQVLVSGKRVPIIGRVCMDQFMVDLTEITSAEIGTAVTLIGRGNQEEITVFELANIAGTIPYEILTSLGSRIKFKYR
ncbi:MAG: alanine racemase [Caldisericia bacterium]